jgi:hypothetical protein
MTAQQMAIAEKTYFQTCQWYRTVESMGLDVTRAYRDDMTIAIANKCSAHILRAIIAAYQTVTAIK